MRRILPTDLWDFVSRRRQLEYDASLAVPGVVRLRSGRSLRIGQVYAAAHSQRDPNRRKRGVYRIPAVSLVKSCEHYDPDYLLAYLPFERALAALDPDHARVTVFTGANWSDLVASPVRYLNALWEESPPIPVSRDEHPWWERYAFFKQAFD